MKKKRIVIFSIILIAVLVMLFMQNKHIGNNNIDNDLLNTVQLYDDKCKELLKIEKISVYTSVLYNTEEKHNLMIFKENKFYGKASSEESLAVFSTTDDITLFVIFGKSDENYNKYNYHFNDFNLSKQINSKYILDIYLLNPQYDVGIGEVLNKEDQIIQKF